MHQIGLGSEVTLAPSPKTPGAFVFRGALSDLATGEVVMAMSVLLRPGEPAKISRFHPESFERYWLSVSVDPSLTVADYQLGIVRERREVVLHKGSVTLPAIPNLSE